MKRIGHYTLHEEVARGGMGVVYRAEDSRTGAPVAVKLLFEPDPRFEQESRALATLDHPGIVGYREAFAADGRQVLVMEWLPGESLQARLTRQGPLPVAEAIRLTLALCDALAHAHARGVLHRDLKPHNVMIDPDGRIRLTDFGLGKPLRGPEETAASLTRTGEIMGTPGYMPPEQASGDKSQIGPASDVYGLGATLYALLTGVPPFRGVTVLNTLHAVLEAPPQPPSALRPELAPALDAVVLRCLAKQPAKRYANAAELAAALQSARPGAARSSARSLALACVLLGALGAATVLLLPSRGAEDPPGLRAEWVAEAEALTAAEDWRALLDHSQAALDEDPEHVEALVRRGEAQLKLGSLDAARADAEAALQLDDTAWRARRLLAVVAVQRGDPQAALVEFDAAQREAPSGDAHGLLLTKLWCLHALGRFDDARNEVERAIAAHDPSAADSDETLGELLGARGTTRWGQGEVKGALEDFDRSLALAPVAESRLQRAKLRQQLGRDAEARHDLDLLIEEPGSTGRGRAAQANALAFRTAFHMQQAEAEDARGGDSTPHLRAALADAEAALAADRLNPERRAAMLALSAELRERLSRSD